MKRILISAVLALTVATALFPAKGFAQEEDTSWQQIDEQYDELEISPEIDGEAALYDADNGEMSFQIDSMYGSNMLDFNLKVQCKQSEARDMLGLINGFRTGSDAWEWNSSNSDKVWHSGLGTLNYDYNLERVALKRACEIIVKFDHSRPDGTKCYTAFAEEGVTYTSAGENIAIGFKNKEDVFNAWREDNEDYAGQGHRRNMLYGKFNAVGIAHIVYNGTDCWVQEFKGGNSIFGSMTAANDGAGTMTIQASADDITGISVFPSASAVRINKGDTVELPVCTTYLLFKNSGRLLLTSGVTHAWSSANNGVASCSGDTVTGVSVGETVLSDAVSAYGRSYTAKVTYKVSDSATKISLSQPSLSLTVGQTAQINYSLGNQNANSNIRFQSTLPSVASVSSDGTVTALSVGTTDIIIRSGDGAFAKCTVTITASTETNLNAGTSGNQGVDQNTQSPQSGSGQTGQTDQSATEENAPWNGWLTVGNDQYWYEEGTRQGTESDPKGVYGDGTNRGREIYDSGSDGWYWLDSVYNGAKACNKEVWMPYIYQGETNWGEDEINANAAASGNMSRQVAEAIRTHVGKWVRYDANGKMIKGWYTVRDFDAQLYPTQVGNTYYYDSKTGLMAKGWLTIDGKKYHFDENTGALK